MRWPRFCAVLLLTAAACLLPTPAPAGAAVTCEDLRVPVSVSLLPDVIRFSCVVCSEDTDMKLETPEELRTGCVATWACTRSAVS